MKQDVSKKVWLVLGIVLAILLSAYLLRGVVRDRVIPWIVTKTQAQVLEGAMQSNVKPINDQLSPLVSFDDVVGPSCDAVAYSMLKETVACSTTVSVYGDEKFYYKVVVDQNFASKWPDVASQTTKKLEELGWKQAIAYEEVDLKNLLNTNPLQDSARAAFYKKYDDISCDYYFEYFAEYVNPSNGDVTPPLFRASGRCDRKVNIFGGFDY